MSLFGIYRQEPESNCCKKKQKCCDSNAVVAVLSPLMLTGGTLSISPNPTFNTISATNQAFVELAVPDTDLIADAGPIALPLVAPLPLPSAFSVAGPIITFNQAGVYNIESNLNIVASLIGSPTEWAFVNYSPSAGSQNGQTVPIVDGDTSHGLSSTIYKFAAGAQLTVQINATRAATVSGIVKLYKLS